MARYTGPRLRVLRALGTNLPGLSAKTIDKRPAPPGQHGAKRRKALSNYGKRLKEKQKLRAHYGVSERQLRTVATNAARARGNAAAALVELLERRLDNVVFRAGLARTIPAARQLVTHGHVSVNGRRHTYPSARLERGDVIGVVGPRGKAAVASQQERGPVLAPPEWLEVNPGDLSAGSAAANGLATVIRAWIDRDRRGAWPDARSARAVLADRRIREGLGRGFTPACLPLMQALPAGIRKADKAVEAALADQDRVDEDLWRWLAALVLQHNLALHARDRHFDHLPQIVRV